MIVATGRTGSIGRYLPAEVIGLKTRLEAPEEEMYRELKALGHPPSVFIHLAAMSSRASCEQEPDRAFQLNVEGACRWLKSVGHFNCRRFIQVSSSHVFNPTPSPVYLETDRPCDAQSVYGRSKVEAEKALSALGEEMGVEVIVARVFSVIDKNMRPGFLCYELHRRARERDFSLISGHRNVRDFIEASEACGQIMKLAHTEVLNGRTFHICTGRPKSVRELAVEVFSNYGIDEAEMATMFSNQAERPNYMMSRTSEFLANGE